MPNRPPQSALPTAPPEGKHLDRARLRCLALPLRRSGRGAERPGRARRTLKKYRFDADQTLRVIAFSTATGPWALLTPNRSQPPTAGRASKPRPGPRTFPPACRARQPRTSHVVSVLQGRPPPEECRVALIPPRRVNAVDERSPLDHTPGPRRSLAARPPHRPEVKTVYGGAHVGGVGSAWVRDFSGLGAGSRGDTRSTPDADRMKPWSVRGARLTASS